MSDILTCPLCGNKFTPDEAQITCNSKLCKQCSGYCCPNCGYKIPRESKIAKWIEGLFQGKKEKSGTDV